MVILTYILIGLYASLTGLAGIKNYGYKGLYGGLGQKEIHANR